MKKLILIVISLSFSFNSFAFNWSKCKRFMHKDPNDLFGIDFSTSTTQWSSSWGECSMLGLAPSEKPKLFLVRNLEKLQVDSSRGNGEYLTSFSKLANCDVHTSQKLTDRLQSSFKQIYGGNLQYDAREVYERISELVKSDKTLSCRYLGNEV